MPTKIFIAYDFEIGGTLPGMLEGVHRRPPKGCDIDWPGSPDGLMQGAIWKDKVEPGIQRCERLLAFVDLPNANVGFEVGFGLGLGKAVALAFTRPNLAPWLGDPPLNGLLCQRFKKLDEIRTILQSPADKWKQLADTPLPGNRVLVLCPPETGAPHLEELSPEWEWRTLPEGGWDLPALPAQLNDVGLVVWVIVPHAEGTTGRDGRENAALSVIAGYAAARPEIELRVLHAKDARPVLDVFGTATKFGSLAEFRKCLERINAEWQAKHPPEPILVSTASVGPERPRIEVLPPDAWIDIPDRFIGRQLQLNDVADAVQGLLHRARTGQEPAGGRAVKVIWVHGFGGMGKSWFLHRARLQAGADVQALIIDWDSTDWRYPLTGEPRCAVDVFETIAYRLVQTCGDAAADPYWLAKERVRVHGELHRRLRDQFEGQFVLATGPERLSSALLRLLQNEGIWVDDLAKRTRNLEICRRDADRWHGLFAAWCRETARDADLAAVEPDRILVEGLRESLRAAALQRALLMILDTGEVLSTDLDRWLRRLVVPLCRDETPLLVLIGSRLRPDVDLSDGSREGWQAELRRERLRSVPFDELVRFTVEDIESALGKLQRPLEGDHENVAEQLHRITRGVPLAVRALFDLHEAGEDNSILRELVDEEDEAPLEESRAVREVIGKAARRMLYHLDPKRKPERADDLRDIIALAVLQRGDGAILKNLWPGQRVRDRLRDLGARYALLSGGDLHAIVREYLRRYWRDEAERPVIFDEVLLALEQAITALPPLSGAEGSPEAMTRRTLQLNLQTWREGDRALPECARFLAVAMAYDEGLEDIQALLKELPLEGKNLLQARKLWKMAEEGPPKATRIISWLRGICDGSNAWSEREQASLAVIEGITSAEWGMNAKDALSAFLLLKSAFEHFGSEQLPQQQQVGEAFFKVAKAFDPYWSKEDRWLSQTAEAYLCAIELGTNEPNCFNNLGNLYQGHLARYTEAEQAYLKAIQLDPKSAYPHNGLGYLYQDHLSRYAEAEQAYLKAIQLDPKYAYPHNGLGNLYKNHLARYAEAEQAYLKAIQLDPKSAYPHNGLGYLYQDHLSRYAEAEQAYLKAIQLDPKYADPHNGLGDLYQGHLARYTEAEQAYLKAIQLDPKSAYPHNGLGYLYQDHLSRYAEAEQAYLKAIQLDPKSAYPHNGLGNLYKNHLSRYAEAEQAYLKAIQLNPKYATPHNGLGNLYQDHLSRYTEAEQAYLKAIQLNPKYATPHNGLGNLYQDHLSRYTEAEQAYLKAIQLDPKDATPHNGLGYLYQDHLSRYTEAEQAYLKAIQLDPKSGSGQRGLAWLCLLHKGDLLQAQQYAKEAMAVDPTHPGSPFAMIAVTTWTIGWATAQALMPEWLAKSPDWFTGMLRAWLIALFRKIREQGGLITLAEMLQTVENRTQWKPWSEAVSALTSGNDPAGCTTVEAKSIYDELSATTARKKRSKRRRGKEQ